MAELRSAAGWEGRDDSDLRVIKHCDEKPAGQPQAQRNHELLRVPDKVGLEEASLKEVGSELLKVVVARFAPRHLVRGDRLAVFQHALMTVGMENCSRVFTCSTGNQSMLDRHGECSQCWLDYQDMDDMHAYLMPVICRRYTIEQTFYTYHHMPSLHR